MANPNIIINGNSYSACPEVDVPIVGGGGTKAKFYYTGDSDITSADVLDGHVGFGPSGQVQGSIPINGATGGTISTKAGTVNIPAGHTTGGTVAIAQAEQNKIVAGNIRSGVTILGQAGSLTTPTIVQDSTTKILTIS